MPEPKTAKNRLHIDMRVSPDAAATWWLEFPEHHAVMADPEGNECCGA